MIGADGDSVAASAATALARVLLLLYPPSFRHDVGSLVVADVRRRANEVTAARGPIRAGLWLIVLAASLLANAAAAWGEAIASWSFSWLDLKLAFRMLARYPGLAVTGGLGMAVAIALGVGFFSMSQWYFHPTIPLSDGERLVGLENWDRRTHREERRSLHDFAIWRDAMKSVEDLTAFRTVTRNVIGDDGSVELVWVAEMLPSAFRLARVPPMLGRVLLDADAAPGAAPAIVIGFDVWRSRFASRPDIVGRDLRLGRTVHTIVGVMPEGFAFPENHAYWTPLQAAPAEYERGKGPAIFIAGRLAPRFTLDDANAELTVIGDRMAAEFPDTHGHLRPEVLPYTYPFAGMNRYSGDAAVPMLVLFSLLLVIVCVNVAVLVYARTAARRGEIAVRSALGASRRRIVLQLFAEALVLAGVAAVVGVLVVHAALEWAARMHQAPPFWLDYRLSRSALLYGAAMTVLAGVITGVVPALQATSRRVQWNLSQFSSTAGLRLGRTWTGLLVFQVAVAVAALPIAIALSWSEARDLFSVQNFAVEQVLFAQVGLGADTRAGQDAAAVIAPPLAALRGELSRRLEAERGVVSHAFTRDLPDGGLSTRVVLERPAADAAASRREVLQSTVDLNFFDTFDVAVLAGRTFGPADRDATAADAVIVNRAFVNQLLAGGNALGRRVRYAGEPSPAAAGAPKERWYEIVGVVDNIDANRFDDARTQARIYHPLAPADRAAMAVRVAGVDRASLAQRIREIAAALDPTAIVTVVPLDEIYRVRRTLLMSGAAALGAAVLSVLLLSAAGIYALMSFTVSQRRREIAIRTALGAERVQLLAGIFRHALRQLAIGVALGIAIAVLLNLEEKGEALRGYGPLLLFSMVVIMTAVGLFAAVGPARRAVRIEPSEALKAE